MNICTAPICGTLVTTSLFAQSDDFHRNNITAGVGPAIPVGSSRTYLETAPIVMVSYGYRFSHLFQLDAGLEAAFGAANNQNAELTNFGPVQGGDHEYMVPMGGRVIIPSRFTRMEFSAGGGAAYLHYSETSPPGAIRVPRAMGGAGTGSRTPAISWMKTTTFTSASLISMFMEKRAESRSATYRGSARPIDGRTCSSSSV